MKALLSNLTFSRILKLVLSIILIAQSFYVKDIMTGIAGFILLAMAIFNIGCCGAIAGFFYWKFEGCSNGQCMISSHPFSSMIYFAVIGALVSSLFKRKNKETLG